MLALPQLKALLKEHNLYRCYIKKDEAIALLLEKGIIIIINRFVRRAMSDRGKRI